MNAPTLDHAPHLVMRAQNGDVDAFSELMEIEQPRLLAQARSLGADNHLAEDLVQETMIAAWQSLARYDGSCRLFTWLYVILLRKHRQTLGWFARRLPLATAAQQSVAESHIAAHATSDPGDSFADAEQLRGMVLALPFRHREVVRLRFYADATEEEMAAALGISRGTVKSRLHHALEKLRRMKEKVNRLRAFGH